MQFLVGNGDAQSLQRAHRVGIKHQDVLQRRAVVENGIEAVEALAVVGDGELHRGIIEDAFGLRCGVGVVDRHAYRADRRQREIEHAPFVTGRREDGHRVAFADAEGDQSLGGGDHIPVKFAGGDVGPLAGRGLAFRDHGVFAGAFEAFGEQGVDGFIVAYLDGRAWSRVLGEHGMFSFSRIAPRASCAGHHRLPLAERCPVAPPIA